MTTYEGGGIECQRPFNYFTRMDTSRVYGADKKLLIGKDAMLAVQEYA